MRIIPPQLQRLYILLLLQITFSYCSITLNACTMVLFRILPHPFCLLLFQKNVALLWVLLLFCSQHFMYCNQYFSMGILFSQPKKSPPRLELSTEFRIIQCNNVWDCDKRFCS